MPLVLPYKKERERDREELGKAKVEYTYNIIVRCNAVLK
jgi:hypothetical protein